MRVPRNAVGRTGQCPNCGRRIPITSEALEPKSNSRTGNGARNAAFRMPRPAAGAGEQDKQRFGQAVDLFYNRRYAEALSIFDILAREYPGNAEIESARRECLRHMKRRALGDGSERLALPPALADLDLAVVKGIVLEKLAHGARDEVQLQAVALALQILRMEARQAALQAGQTAADHHGETKDGEHAAFETPESAEEPVTPPASPH